jgi:RNA polymerase sigma factor (sigma-70 family)
MTRQQAITQEGFDRFLDRLAENREKAGQEYERVRGRLILYFQCRDVLLAEDCADEAINRIIHKMEAGEEIRDPVAYVFGIARMVLLETARRQQRQQAIEDTQAVPPPLFEEENDPQLRLACLRNCLQELSIDERELITQYYEEQNRAKIDLRQKLAERFGIDMNALRVRAFRLRSALQKCVGKCLRKSTSNR